MSLASIHSRAPFSLDAPLVRVEVHLANGLPQLALVGLPEKAVKESKDRVRAAILNSGFEFPQKRITISLAPADLPKDGARYDLAIALGILAASGQIPATALEQYEFHGELALSGELRTVRGVLPCALASSNAKRFIVVPVANISEAKLVADEKVRGAQSLAHIAAILHGQQDWISDDTTATTSIIPDYPDFSDVIGHQQVKRALLIAAAGGHHILMSGPPGTGKTLLASRLPGLLPPLSEQEALEVAAVQSVVNLEPLRGWPQRPFRQPHHSASGPALVGGGSRPQPGEISLAHQGILFLDELPEFDRKVLEVLREPLESGYIVIARAHSKVRFPARFQLVAAMNPCPCGYFGDPSGRCRCSHEQVQRYRHKLSGPLLDRIDLHISVARETTSLRQPTEPGLSSAQAVEQVCAARERQMQRQGCSNAQLDLNALRQHCVLEEEDRIWLEQASERLNLSLRATHRILKVARTLADLEAIAAIHREHLAEALQYRFSEQQ